MLSRDDKGRACSVEMTRLEPLIIGDIVVAVAATTGIAALAARAAALRSAA